MAIIPSVKKSKENHRECIRSRNVHHGLIVSHAAVRNASQRVHKAIKLGIPIVDVSWIEACADGGTRVDWTEYLRDDEAREVAEAKKRRREPCSTLKIIYYC